MYSITSSPAPHHVVAPTRVNAPVPTLGVRWSGGETCAVQWRHRACAAVPPPTRARRDDSSRESLCHAVVGAARAHADEDHSGYACTKYRGTVPHGRYGEEKYKPRFFSIYLCCINYIIRKDRYVQAKIL